MSSRSTSSSPDILGPPGDVEYLISSPTKPFAGRQSWVSPANFRLLQTPGKKRKRVSLSPVKSAHSIRFDDVLLPGSPTMKLNGRQGRTSASPRPMGQSDGNSSPWRIRVTLEASEDEENNNSTSPSRKRFKPETTTTKVPLKEDRGIWEQTPKRGRGRPRKSGGGATPNLGGPGSTPGPKIVSQQKKKRGRPRKSIPELDFAEVPEVGHQIPIAEPEQRWSPVDLAVDGDSDDGFPDTLSPVGPYEHDQEEGQHDLPGPVGSSPPQAFTEPEGETPNVDTTGQRHIENDDNIDNSSLHSTPSKKPSPVINNHEHTRENTLHAGHTPRPRRVYPTPTSSSLIEEEHQGQKKITTENGLRQSQGRVTNDPTEEHREFDSIMESEGFSMVSLDTLPSAKQHGLASGKKLVQPKMRPFIHRQNSGILDKMQRKASASSSHEAVPTTAAFQSNSVASVDRPVPRSPSQSPDPLPELRQTSTTKQMPPESHPSSSVRPVQAQVPAATHKKQLPSLARVVRVGIALRGALRRQRHGSALQNSLSSPEGSEAGGPSENLESPRRRLELLFNDLGSDTQRELRAALRFGEVLAKRQREGEVRRARERTKEQAAAAEISEKDQSPAEDIRRLNVESRTPQQQTRGDESRGGSFYSEMKRRQAEWQRERETISREIQMANSSQVIVIESDAPTAEGNEEDYGSERESDQEAESEAELESEAKSESESRSEPESEAESESNLKSEQDPEREPEQEPSDEEEAYEDIWQQEANDQPSNRFRTQSRLKEVSSRRKKVPFNIPSDDAGTASPAYWTAEKDEVPFLGKSQVKQLREQEVDLSVLLRARDTPNRLRYYYGNSPQSTIGRQSPMQRSTAGYSRGDSNRRLRELNAQLDHGAVPSPGRSHNGDVSLRDAERYERENLQSPEGEDGRNVSDAGEQSAYERSALTPESAQHDDADRRASSWFQRITSLTPAWLKAPKSRPIEQPRPHSNEKWSEEEEEEQLPNGDVDADLDYEEEGQVPDEDADADLDYEERRPTAEPTKDMDTDIHDDASSEYVEQTPTQQTQRTPLNPNDLVKPIETYNTQPPPQPEPHHNEKQPRRPLALSGYFTDDHYTALHRLYMLAKRRPELFPYHPAPGRAEIIGDWIWTSDGRHGVPVTEGQFAVIDRFVQQLAREDLEHGGTGQMKWTEAELHKRLISIVIGEQIRAERKTRVEESSREVSAEGWRR